jgi:integrase
MRKEEREIKYLSQKELKKLFDTIEKTKDNNKLYLRDLLIFNLMYFLALRVSEVGVLLFEDYNSLNNTIYIRRLKGSNNNTLKLDDKRLKLMRKYIREYNISS